VRRRTDRIRAAQFLAVCFGAQREVLAVREAEALAQFRGDVEAHDDRVTRVATHRGDGQRVEARLARRLSGI
jgi:hypothetical protein